MRIALIIMLTVVFVAGVAQSQPDTGTKYTVEALLTVGLKYTRFVNPTTEFTDRQIFPGVTVKARLHWFPNHLLGIGIQSGYELFAIEKHIILDDEGVPSVIEMQLSGVPIHAVFEMRPNNFRLGVGLGIYLLESKISFNGSITKSSDLAFGVSALVGYEWHIFEDLHVSPEIGLYMISDRSIVSVSPSITLRYDIFRY